MSDGYCERHYISYCPNLSTGCPYCRIEELEAKLNRVEDLCDMRGPHLEKIVNRDGVWLRHSLILKTLEKSDG